MAVYYHKLWALLQEKKMTQKTLTEKTGISTATVFQMKRNEYVSLGVLDRIASVLQCDFKDMITNVAPYQDQSSGFGSILDLHRNPELVLSALTDYMEQENLSVKDVLEITTLSLNTLKKLLNGGQISQNSCYKLLRLGTEYSELIIKKYGKPCAGFL